MEVVTRVFQHMGPLIQEPMMELLHMLRNKTLTEMLRTTQVNNIKLRIK